MSVPRRIRGERSSDNVFVDLGFEPAEATVMQMRAVFAIAIEMMLAVRAGAQPELRLPCTKWNA